MSKGNFESNSSPKCFGELVVRTGILLQNTSGLSSVLEVFPIKITC